MTINVPVPWHDERASLDSQNAPESISERLKFKNILGDHVPRPQALLITVCAVRVMYMLLA